VEIPDLNDVRTFVAIGQEGTLTAAARQLNLPTSTVSRALTRLEKYLDVLLAQRSPRGLVMTDFGKEYSADLQASAANLAGWKRVAGKPSRTAKRPHQDCLSHHHGAPHLCATC
jgi:DNA-binding transcriptional LysR family regulator